MDAIIEMEKKRANDRLETEAAIRSITVNPEIETGQMIGAVKEVTMYKDAVVGGKITFGWRKVRKGVKTPSRKNWKRVGWNCYAAENVKIKRGEREIVPLGVSIVHWPENTCGRFVGRMELSLFHGIEVGSVIVEPDYYDELKVVVFNHGVSTFEIKKEIKSVSSFSIKFIQHQPLVLEQDRHRGSQNLMMEWTLNQWVRIIKGFNKRG